MATKTHLKESDNVCGRCKMLIRSRIPHECDPSICKVCDGNGYTWDKRGWGPCDACEGDGMTKWR